MDETRETRITFGGVIRAAIYKLFVGLAAWLRPGCPAALL